MAYENPKRSGSIPDPQSEQLESRLRKAGDQARRDFFEKNAPLTYQDERCPTEDYFIQEYADGRIHLMHFEIFTGKFTLIKNLANG
jgi:hypothetical protein